MTPPKLIEPLDDDSKIVAMIELATMNPRYAEIWVDRNIVGLPIIEIARREGVGRQRIHQMLGKIDAKILPFLRRATAR